MHGQVAITPKVAEARQEWFGLTAAQRAGYVRAAISETGSSRTELSDDMGIAFATVSGWCNEGSGLQWYVWMAITRALDLPLTWRPTGPVPAKMKPGRPPTKKAS